MLFARKNIIRIDLSDLSGAKSTYSVTLAIFRASENVDIDDGSKNDGQESDDQDGN
jgi:hypothetical protein